MSTELQVMRQGESDPLTVLIPRTRRNWPNISVFTISDRDKGVHGWTPAADGDSDSENEIKLAKKMKSHLRSFLKSKTCVGFLNQLRNPDFFGRIEKILTSEANIKKQMRIVVYGLGSIGKSDRSATQLCFALFLKRKFDWIGGIDVFDPIVSSTEAKVLASLGCYVVPFNEQCRRRVTEPTIFFMPHCEIFMYENVLEANWRADLLSNIIILGNSFESYRQERGMVSVFQLATHVFAAADFVEEVKLVLPLNDEQFSGLSWHFFSPPAESHLTLMELDQSFARVLTMNNKGRTMQNESSRL